MKQITSIAVSRLRVEEDFGFLKLVVAETENLVSSEEDDRPEELILRSSVNPILTSSISEFTVAVDAFDKALKESVRLTSTAVAAEADDARDAAWRYMNNYLKAMCHNPIEDVADAAAEVLALFEKYGDPTKLSQTEESGVLHNLLQDLELFSTNNPDRAEGLVLSVWYGNLKSKEEAFLEAVAVRTEEEASRVVGIVKDSRAVADAAYIQLVGRVNALAMIEGDEAYATFIDHVNALIARQKTIMKSRSTRSKKAKEESAS